MSDTHNLIAFLAVVTAIVALALIGGTGSDLAIMTGLIGVLGTFRPRERPKPEPAGTPADPIATKEIEP
jgi:hypothetical protein